MKKKTRELILIVLLVAACLGAGYFLLGPEPPWGGAGEDAPAAGEGGPAEAPPAEGAAEGD